MKLLRIIAATALLTGCATAVSDGPVCPALAQYPPEVQRQAATEINALPPDAALVRMIEDYGELRARLRAACSRR